jgi:hypothetical protein
MVCKACGATIADKAIVGYRCGAPTAGQAGRVRPPAPVVTARRVALAVLALLTIVAVVVLASQGARSTWGWMAIGDLVLVVVVSVLLFGRRA